MPENSDESVSTVVQARREANIEVLKLAFTRLS